MNENAQDIINGQKQENINNENLNNENVENNKINGNDLNTMN